MDNSNKETFLSLIQSISRPNANISALIDKLEKTDFFYAPASANHFNSVAGGLVTHSLSTYYNLKALVEMKGLSHKIDNDSIIICGLLHDVSKVNYFTKTVKNKKEYHEGGLKSDALGRYDWVSEEGYITKPEEERFIYGNREENSEFIIRQYIPLKYEESMAILHCLGGKGFDSNNMSLCTMWKKYPLTLLLHIADEMSSYIDINYYE